MIELYKLTEYLQLFKEFSMEDVKLFFSALARSKTLRAGEVYIAAGDTNRKLAHIKQGLVRAYMVNEEGVEKTLFFRKEDQQIAAYDCIFKNEPSRFYIEAFEETVIIELDYDQLQAFMERHPQYEKARRHFIQNLLMETLTRLEGFVLLSNEERYLDFISRNPGLVQRVPEKYIASVLGITPESLSRIKKRIKEKSEN